MVLVWCPTAAICVRVSGAPESLNQASVISLSSAHFKRAMVSEICGPSGSVTAIRFFSDINLSVILFNTFHN
jgi:hypothetical protein